MMKYISFFKEKEEDECIRRVRARVSFIRSSLIDELAHLKTADDVNMSRDAPFIRIMSHLKPMLSNNFFIFIFKEKEKLWTEGNGTTSINSANRL